jgi:hypothetical protein
VRARSIAQNVLRTVVATKTPVPDSRLGVIALVDAIEGVPADWSHLTAFQVAVNARIAPTQETQGKVPFCEWILLQFH